MRSVLRKDKVNSTYFGGGHIHNVVINDLELENGFVVKLGDFLTGERELREALVPTGAEDKVVLISHPEVMYDESKLSSNSLQKFYREEGQATRAMDLTAGDIISISKEGLTLLGADAVVGNYVIPQAGSAKLAESATVAGTEGFVGKIIGNEPIGTATMVGEAGSVSRVIDFVVIEVQKA